MSKKTKTRGPGRPPTVPGGMPGIIRFRVSPKVRTQLLRNMRRDGYTNLSDWLRDLGLNRVG